ncbi:hypothetical protein RRF57_003717 [Xylaria bambusicola]|uniref:Uncharacterized protein n=1 Tax=Xylaria bambusicola TaxID=326684 RepID=A0AAN7UGW4_9PEZI
MVRSSFVLSLLASAGGLLSVEAKKLPKAKHLTGSYVVEFEDSQVCMHPQLAFRKCSSNHVRPV